VSALDTAKPATVSSEPALNFEQLGGPLNSLDTREAAFFQASRLSRRYVLTFDTARTNAALAYYVVAR
jgi:hypothetical protein